MLVIDTLPTTYCGYTVSARHIFNTSNLIPIDGVLDIIRSTLSNITAAGVQYDAMYIHTGLPCIPQGYDMYEYCTSSPTDIGCISRIVHHIIDGIDLMYPICVYADGHTVDLLGISPSRGITTYHSIDDHLLDTHNRVGRAPSVDDAIACITRVRWDPYASVSYSIGAYYPVCINDDHRCGTRIPTRILTDIIQMAANIEPDTALLIGVYYGRDLCLYWVDGARVYITRYDIGREN